MSDMQEVIDITFYFKAPGENGEPAKLRYTVRPDLGDLLVDKTPGVINIVFSPREGVKRRIVTMADFCGVEREYRLEPKTRPSIASFLNKEKAEVDELKKRAGVVVS